MPLDIEPIICTVRWYDTENGYEQKLPYKAVATLSIMGRDTVFISGMHGSISSEMLRELAIWAKENNIKHVFSSRKGKWKKYDIDAYIKHASVV